MAVLAAEGVAAGALGFSTSRTMNHRTSRGEPTPTLTASADELVGIARALGGLGRGVLQVVSDHVTSDEEFAIFRRMVAESGRPLSFSLVQNPFDPDSHRQVLERIDAARADGLPITAQVGTRAVGLLFGLQCTLHPFLNNPVFTQIAGRPVHEHARIMADEGFKARVLEAAAGDKVRKLGGGLISHFEAMYELEDPPDYEPDGSQTISARATREGRAVEDFVYDLLIADEGRTLLYLPALNFAGRTLDAVGEMLAHPHTLPGLGDGGAHVDTICDGSFPTTLLTLWGRDRDHGRFELPYLVRQQCRDTARAVGIEDRGVLAPGYRADLNVVDFDDLRVRRPEVRGDLPAAGGSSSGPRATSTPWWPAPRPTATVSRRALCPDAWCAVRNRLPPDSPGPSPKESECETCMSPSSVPGWPASPASSSCVTPASRMSSSSRRPTTSEACEASTRLPGSMQAPDRLRRLLRRHRAPQRLTRHRGDHGHRAIRGPYGRRRTSRRGRARAGHRLPS